MKLKAAMAAGAIATTRDFEPASCDPAAVGRSFRYDPQARAARATHDLRAGETTRALPSFVLAEIRPGQPLYLKAHVGPAVIEREVHAIQSARPGQRVFVKTQDGAVFSAPVPDVVP